MKDIVSTWREKLLSFIRRKIFRIKKHRWNHQYSTGRWDGLRTNEMNRLNAAKELLKKYVARGKVLEIGCGEGVFFYHVANSGFSFYEGIDVSEVAVSKISATRQSLFRVADMEKYVPENGPFTVIVLNEVLYYSKSPLGVLMKYNRHLADHGVFIIGMYSTPKNELVWKQLATKIQVLESVRVEQDEKTWDYKVVRMACRV